MASKTIIMWNPSACSDLGKTAGLALLSPVKDAISAMQVVNMQMCN